MKHLINRFICILLAGITPILASCTEGPSQTEEPHVNESEITCETMTIGENLLYSSRCISGDLFYGIEYRYNRGVNERIIVSYNLKTGEKESLIEFDPQSYTIDTPAVDGDLLVWCQADISDAAPDPEGPDSINYDVFVYDMKTGETRRITDDEYVQKGAVISGSWVAWLDNRNGSGELYPYPTSRDIYAYNLDTGEQKRVTAESTAEGYGSLAIHGDLVVWSDNRYGDPEVKSRPSNVADYNNEIFAYNLRTGEEKQITDYEGNDHYPAVYGNRIAWLRQIDYRKADIMVYDLETGKEIKVSTSGYADYIPSVYEDRVVWVDAGISKGNTCNDVVENGVPGAAEIYGYDLAFGEESLPVPSKRRVLLSPVLSGDYLVYTWSRQISPVTYVDKPISPQDDTVPESTIDQPPEKPDLNLAQPYRITGESSLAIEGKERSAGRWLITSGTAVSFEERSQTVIRAVLDLYDLFRRDYTSVTLVAGEDLEGLDYASASFAADGLGPEGMTGSAPANHFYWKVRATDYIYSELELETARLWSENMHRFPQTNPLSSCSYDEKALRQHVADVLGIPAGEVQMPDPEMKEYEPDEPLPRQLAPAGNPKTELSLVSLNNGFSPDSSDKDLIERLVRDIPEETGARFLEKYDIACEVSKDTLWMMYSSWRPYTQSDEYRQLLAFCKEQGQTIWPLLFERLDGEGAHFAGGLILDVTIPEYLYYFNRTCYPEETANVTPDFTAYVRELIIILEKGPNILETAAG
ncbi:MAG: hypothetical protein JW712_01410 [Dehalococcoidales bacterium]|nr:hypothetical protein [Dehalococcoidales bacterium]